MKPRELCEEDEDIKKAESKGAGQGHEGRNDRMLGPLQEAREAIHHRAEEGEVPITARRPAPASMAAA